MTGHILHKSNLKEQGKSQGTGRETQHTQPAVYLGQEKLEIKILQVLSDLHGINQGPNFT